MIEVTIVDRVGVYGQACTDRCVYTEYSHPTPPNVYSAYYYTYSAYSAGIRKKSKSYPLLWSGVGQKYFVYSERKKNKKNARTRIRTEDLIITSDALYQLSHTSELFTGSFFWYKKQEHLVLSVCCCRGFIQVENVQVLRGIKYCHEYKYTL